MEFDDVVGLIVRLIVGLIVAFGSGGNDWDLTGVSYRIWVEYR